MTVVGLANTTVIVISSLLNRFNLVWQVCIFLENTSAACQYVSSTLKWNQCRQAYTPSILKCDIHSISPDDGVSKSVLYRPHMIQKQLECGPMPNVMAALQNIGGGLCSTPQSLGDAHYKSAVTLPRRETRWNMLGCPKLVNRSQPLVGRSSPYLRTCGGIAV